MRNIILGAAIGLALIAGQAGAIEVNPVPVYTLQLEGISTAELKDFRDRLTLEANDARNLSSLHNPRYKRLQRQISRVENELGQRADAAEPAATK